MFSWLKNMQPRHWGRVARSLLGDVKFDYNPPSWAVTTGSTLHDSMRRRPAIWASSIVALGVLAGAGWKGYHWWEAHKPRPREIVEQRESIGKVSPPGLTLYAKDDIPKIDAASISFSVATAPLDVIDKDTPPGLTIAPALEGSWRWRSGRFLSFKPKAPWPAGTEYTISLDTTHLGKDVKLKQASWTFTTPALSPSIKSTDFYTDPKDPTTHQVVAELRFSHPVKHADVEKHIALEVLGGSPLFDWQGKAPATRFTLLDGKDEPKANTERGYFQTFYLRTSRLVLPAKEDFMKLSLSPGLVALEGGAASKEVITEKVRVPDIYTGFTIKEITSEIVPTSDGEPQQFLFIDTDGYATSAEVAKNVKAWLLPKDSPAIPGQTKGVGGALATVPARAVQRDYEWPNVKEVTPSILALAQPIVLKPVEMEKAEDAPMATRHAFKYLVERTGHLFIKVNAGTTALGGFILKDDRTITTAVPEFPKELQILSKGSVLALNGERKVSIKTRGAHHLRYTLARVPSAQVNHLARFARGDFESPQFSYSGLDESNIAHFYREVKPVTAPNDYEAVYNVFDFSEALARPDNADLDASRGLFILTVESVRPRKAEDKENNDEDENENGTGSDPDPTLSKWVKVRTEHNPSDDDDDSDADRSTRRLILITDLGLIVKREADGTRHVFVQSIGQQSPQAGATISILAKNGEYLAQATTDAEGHVKLPNVEDLQREKTPVAITARVGNDLAFIPFSKPDRVLDFSRFDTGGVLASQKDELDAFLFTERGVYRPGDPIHLSGIVRRRDWSGKLEGLPLKVSMMNAKHEEVRSQRIALSADGFFDWTADTDEADPTGKYLLDVSLVLANNNEQQLGFTAVRIEDFQPDRMKMALTLNTTPTLAWVQPRDVKASINVQTLFGFPAAERRIKAKLELSPAAFAFDAFPDFTFHNRGQLKIKADDDESENHDDDFAGKRVDLGELKTNAEGNAEIDLKLERFEGGSFSMRVVAEAFEADGGRSVQAATSTLVAPMPYVLGYKADGDLSYIAKDSPRSLKIIGLSPELKPQGIPGLTARLYHQRYVSVLTKQDSGSYQYVSTLRETAAPDVPFTLPPEGTTSALPSSEAGDFRLELRDAENHIVLATRYTVVGKGESQRSLEREAELELKLSRPNYITGDPLDLSLRAPYTGSGLITIERDSVLGWQWFKSTTTASAQRILVPPGFEGTGYVNVAFVRALDSPEVFMSPLSYAVEPFVANADKHKLAVTLDAPKKVKPGELIRIGYSTATAGRIAIYAVDEGILNITDYKLPQPVTHFMRKRALETETHQLLDLILPEYSLLSKKAFGGGEDPGIKVHMNPFKRRKDAPVVFWSGLVASGPERREVTYTVPDYFDGNLKIMAVAVSADTLGASETQSLVRGPFILTPNVPTFAAPGDEFTVSLTVANNLEGGNAPVTVTLDTSTSTHVQLIDAAQQSLQVAPGRETTTRLRLKALDVLGGAEITFNASAGSETMKRSSTLSIRPAAPYMTDVQSGYFRLSKQDVALSRQLYPHLRKAEATVSALPLGLARGLENYLREYPHGCSEQVTSRAMSRLLLASEIDFGFDAAESAAAIDSALTLLLNRQNSEGGFGYWSYANGDGSPNDFLSVYVTHFLTEAKEANHALPPTVLEDALKYLRAGAKEKISNLAEANIQAAAIYLLTRNGEVTTNYVVNLRDSLQKNFKDKWQTELCAAYIASTYALLRKTDEAKALIAAHWAAADHKPQTNPWRSWYYESPTVQQAQAFMLICRHFPDMAKTFGYNELSAITEPIAQNHFNTLSAAYSILALKSYSQLVARTDMKVAISALMPANAQPQILLPDGQGIRSATFAAGIPGLRFTLDQGSTDLGAFYQVTESGYDKAADMKPIADGIEVSRDLLDAQGNAVTTLTVGQSATVQLRLLNNSPDALRQIALLDLMPGGFEIEQGTLRPGTDTVPGADYVDVREDRNVFYLSLGKGESRTFKYRIKPICAGKYAVPPVYAECMYDRGVKGRAGGGNVEVKAAE